MTKHAIDDHLDRALYRELIGAALLEDLGVVGDVTSNATVGPDQIVRGALVARQRGRLCGLDIAVNTFKRLASELVVDRLAEDGQDLEAGEIFARIRGNARAVLAAERTALNYLGHLSGIATATRRLARKVEKYGTRLMCTRKTIPGLRALEKYAVRVGGGSNHRFGLYDAVLIKDNHRVLAGGVAPAIRKAKSVVGDLAPIEIEVDDLNQLDQALQEGVDVVLLDNMAIPELRVAVARCRGRALCEASGGIGPDTIEEVAKTGVDVISVGWITHSAPALDVALDLVPSSESSESSDSISKNFGRAFDTLRSRE